MTLPKQPEIEIPLLRALVKLGGQAKPRDLYKVVQEAFHQITPEDLMEKVSGGHLKWWNRVQWVRQALIEKGEMESGGWGIWRITEKGRKGIEEAGGEGGVVEPVHIMNLEEIWDAYEEAFRAKTLERLLSLTPEQFEKFGKEFLVAYGFQNVEVTDVGPDGGIDGFGELRVGVAIMKVAFQCKRWKGNVPRSEIDKFRGATQGAYEQGIFFTTADFAKGAKEASIKRGAIPIILINGPELVGVMLSKEFGIVKRPLYIFDELPIPRVEDEAE